MEVGMVYITLISVVIMPHAESGRAEIAAW